MSEKAEEFNITPENMNRYLVYLAKKGYTGSTIEKYNRDITAFNEYIHGVPATKELADAWKNELTRTYSASSVNSMLAAVKNFAEFLGVEMKIKRLKDSYRSLLVPQTNEITKSEYEKLLKTAKEMGDERLFYIMKTMCSTGVQVSELSSVTVEAVERGEIEAKIRHKLEQKVRSVKLSGRLRQELLSYAEREGIYSGCIFITRSGTPVHRANIWTSMKQLCQSAGVEPSKVYPQNLRYLSIRTFYDDDRDVALNI